jgi:hypothetical protein
LPQISRQIRIAFIPAFGIILAIVLFLFQARVDFLSISTRYVVINAILAILISLGATTLLLAGYAVLARLFRKTWRRLLIRITSYTLEQATNQHSKIIHATGIGEREGSVVIRLEIGSQESVVPGDKFEVSNIASKEKLGTIEVIEIEETSCVCSVFDRINVHFWDGLEERMRRDPSPPSGVIISREFPEGILESMQILLRNWRG